jgi:hypothetical protein
VAGASRFVIRTTVAPAGPRLRRLVDDRLMIDIHAAVHHAGVPWSTLDVSARIPRHDDHLGVPSLRTYEPGHVSARPSDTHAGLHFRTPR